MVAAAPNEKHLSNAPGTVTLTASEYDALIDRLEELEAILAYRVTRNEELVPGDVVDRLLAGENPIRVWRSYRGISLDTIAEAAGKSKKYIADIEAGRRKGSLPTLIALAHALKVDLEDLAS